MTLECGRFDETIAVARARDFVYCDPPYAPLSRTASFAQYTAAGFGALDHRRLQNGDFRGGTARGARAGLEFERTRDRSGILRAFGQDRRPRRSARPRTPRNQLAGSAPRTGGRAHHHECTREAPRGRADPDAAGAQITTQRSEVEYRVTTGRRRASPVSSASLESYATVRRSPSAAGRSPIAHPGSRRPSGLRSSVHRLCVSVSPWPVRDGM